MFVRLINRLIKSKQSFSALPTKKLHCRWLCSASKSDDLSNEFKNIEKYLEKLKTEFNELKNGGINTKSKQNRMTSLTKIINTAESRNVLLNNLEILKTEIENEKDKEMIKLIEEEQNVSFI